ncbi:chaperonin 10-like protein [Halteromyces radiatus]|uniref:chaperonin 10-like protein n=1 Tax=Halteromyces radiatus TaxID=101107 RepID=UPI00221FF2E2|nr:chaperonin 10-like protein [Halteromyces radiatus]KAI8079984.1 chaperonin 10-like protein [Halteromyces radiatus]
MTSETFVGYAGLKPYVRDDPTTHLQHYTFEPRPLDDDEVEIAVSACGICGSDIHQLTNGWKRANYPIIPGHEFIGRITAIGKAVNHLNIDDRVGVSPICRTCGNCELCKTARGQYCSQKVTTYNSMYKGIRTFGGYANKVRVQADWAIKIPDNISDEEGAPLLCAGITTYTPFKFLNIDQATSIGVVGIGGLGHLAIQWGRAKQCHKVVAISSTKKKEAEAKQLGATDFIALQDGPLPSQPLVDVLFVCGSGPSTSWADLMSLVHTGGKVVLLDLPEQPITIPPSALVYRQIALVGSFVGSNADLHDMLLLASQANVRPWIQKIGKSLEQVNQGVLDLMDGKAHYRIVICGENK